MATNPNVTPLFQGSGARGSTRGGGPQDSTTGATHDGGVLAPESDSVAGAAIVGGAPTGAKPMAGASSSQAQMGAAAPLLDDDDDDNEFEVVMGRPCLQALKRSKRPFSRQWAQPSLHYT
jgi:hypothetical protein